MTMAVGAREASLVFHQPADLLGCSQTSLQNAHKMVQKRKRKKRKNLQG